MLDAGMNELCPVVFANNPEFKFHELDRTIWKIVLWQDNPALAAV